MKTWQEVMGPCAVWAWSNIRFITEARVWRLSGSTVGVDKHTPGILIATGGGEEIWAWDINGQQYYSTRAQ